MENDVQKGQIRKSDSSPTSATSGLLRLAELGCCLLSIPLSLLVKNRLHTSVFEHLTTQGPWPSSVLCSLGAYQEYGILGPHLTHAELESAFSLLD